MEDANGKVAQKQFGTASNRAIGMLDASRTC
jgi:hypothetical protein